MDISATAIDNMLDMLTSTYFPLIAFFALGIERILYGWCYIFTSNFKKSCDNGIVGSFLTNVKKEEYYWRHMQQLGAYVKIFQVSIILFDLFLWQNNNNILRSLLMATDDVSTSSTIKTILEENAVKITFGVVLAILGQTLNVAAFNALGVKGIYYGYEMGYPMKRVTKFPYNLPFSDPQYWGVLCTIWGLYLALGVKNYLVPCLEVFWYVLSMKVLENSRGKQWFGTSTPEKET